MEEKKENYCSECYSYDDHDEHSTGGGYCWHWYEFVKPTREACQDFLQ